MPELGRGADIQRRSLEIQTRSMSEGGGMSSDSVPPQDSTMTTSPPGPGSTVGASCGGNPLDEAVDASVTGGTLARH